MKSETHDAHTTNLHFGFVDHVMNAIESTPILQEPFPHIYIDGIFPKDFYWELIHRFDEQIKFKKAIYPGTSVDTNADDYKDFGLIASDIESDELLRDVYALLNSEQFSRALLDKFSAPGSRQPNGTAIPEDKHIYFKNSSDFTPVFDLHLDLPGYEIPPHPDHPSKIVTFLFYLAKDTSLAKYGTHICVPKQGVTPRKPTVNPLERMLSTLSGKYGLAQRGEWYRWEDFDIVKTAEAMPNTFLSFAPNEISYHAVRMNAPRSLETKGRPIIRGFIRTGSNESNFLSSYQDSVGRRVALWLAGLFNRSGSNH